MAAIKKKVLIIEDEKPMAHALELKLSNAGFETCVAGNGEEGLAALKKQKCDVVLLDLIMPKMDGFSVLRQLQKDENPTPIIVLSNLGQEDDQKRSIKLGAKGFFIKSNMGIAEIVDAVKEFLKKK
jgi:DNA-binding response OmpR family regulator